MGCAALFLPLECEQCKMEFGKSRHCVQEQVGLHRESACSSLDIDIRARLLSVFFPLGNTLPCHRLAYSSYGGLFQPTMTQAIRLLSNGPFDAASTPQPSRALTPRDIGDPFSDGHLTYTTNGIDTVNAPSAYASRRHAWVHIFPEGKIHQHPDKIMRYFKWGVSRLILESDPMPDFVPIWIEGIDQVMHESREWPRFLPRPGKNISITFGEKVDTETVFGDLRERWALLKKQVGEGNGHDDVGVLRNEELMHGEEAVALRKECTLRVRQEVLKLRRARGLPDEDPKDSLVDTWRQEGSKGQKQGQMEDGSWVRDT